MFDYLTLADAAHYLLVTGEFQKAKDYLDRSILMNGAYANTRYNIAYALIQLNDTVRATREARIAADLYEDARFKFDALMMVGRLTLESGDAAKRFFSMYPKNPSANNMIINNFYNAGELKSYTAFSDQLAEEYDDPEILGNIYFHRGIAKMYLSEKVSALADLNEAKAQFGKAFPPDHQAFSEIENMKKQLQK